MLYDPDPTFVKEITNGDVPMAEKVDVVSEEQMKQAD